MMRFVIASCSASEKVVAGSACERSGTIVLPAWPPTTGTLVFRGSKPLASDTKVRARHASSEVTPKSLRGSKTPFCFNVSAATGTVEFTGLEITKMQALGHASAQPVIKVLTMLALMAKRSSRVMPGLRGTPAGITTTSQPSKAFLRSSPTKPMVFAPVAMCDKSTATPVQSNETSYNVSSATRGFNFRSRDNGWPMPPAPPQMQTLKLPVVLPPSSLATPLAQFVKHAMASATQRPGCKV
mmetsp:Transcript_37465/g.106280  ORF Transcript_37465/g.106280 Transcript_37465/m.106280 type:complete len:241 (-) Transcript_37465:14-736(-)